MINRIISTHIDGKLINAKRFCFTATGDLSEAVKRDMERFVRKLNRKHEKELLRVEYSGKSSILMTDEARKQMKMIVSVPDEAELTIKEMKAVFAQAEMLASIAHDADDRAYEYAARLKLPDEDNGFKYYRVDLDSDSDIKFSISEIHPVSDAEYAQILARLRDEDNDEEWGDIVAPLRYDSEYDFSRFAVTIGIALCEEARSLISEHLNTSMLIRDRNLDGFLQLMGRLDEIPSDAFEDEGGLIERFYRDAKSSIERMRTCSLEGYMGAWLGEYIHAINPDWDWFDINLENKREWIRLVLMNANSGVRIDPMGLIRSFLRDGDDTKIRELVAGIQNEECVLPAEEIDIDDECSDIAGEVAETEALPECIFDDDEPDVRLLSLDCPTTLSEDKQKEICGMIDALNEETGFEAMGYLLASHIESHWEAEHERSISFGEMLLDAGHISDDKRKEIETRLEALKSETFDLSGHMFTFVLMTDETYTFDQLKSACKVLQKVYDCILTEFDEDAVAVEAGQRIALDDGHTWVKITIEDGEVIWRDEYCPYEGEYARVLQQVCYDDYDLAYELDQTMMHLPSSIWQDDPETLLPIIARIRALKFIDIMRDYFDREIDISTDSLEAVALFMIAVRNSLTADCMHLRKDASPRIVRMFKDLIKRENEDGAFEMLNFDNVLYQEIICPLSGWLGELVRTNCANLVWKLALEDDEDGGKTKEYVLEETEQKLTYYPSAHAEKFFYRRQGELGIEEYYHSLIEQMHLKPAVKHEYRFKHLPEDKLSNNILPFRTK